MSLTQEQIKKLSLNLSKIRLDTDKLADEIKGVLDYVNLLNEIDTSGIIPTISLTDKDNLPRDDKIESLIEPKELLECSNQKIIGNQIAISNIMK